MHIMTQDHKKLINSEYVSEFYIKETDKNVELIAVGDTDILLGTYSKQEHAEMVLEFIGHCLVDEEAQTKVTQVPSRKIVESHDERVSDILKERLAHEMPSGGF